jgi:asparagine synthase (glutamine-hydrolysing)
MCGIAGILNVDGAPVDPGRLRAMADSLSHRGPDEDGIFVDGHAGLAHRRLSIIDLAGGQQPMATADETLWITFNGEIFNYVELRDVLAARGHVFRTKSDTEVILHLYQEHGEDCVRFLNGQWAFAIWDAGTRTLFLSRDRIGVRPLFYTRAGRNSFIFASEIKALFQNREVPRAIDPEALDEIFTFWTPLAPRTPFAGVSELPPGHSLTVVNGEVRQRCYWRPSYDVVDGLTDEQYAERLLDLLVDATRIRLRADVPVGAYLSGGLDSTVTTAIVKRFTSRRLRTFSVTFADPEFDESGFQQQAVADLATDHAAFHCTDADIARVFPDVIWHGERPVLRTAPAPLFLLSRMVRDQGYKVVVTGEGADEMLGGYDIFKEAKIRRFWSVFPNSTLRPRLLHRLYPYMESIQSQPPAYLRAFFRITDADCASPFFSHLPRWSMTSRLRQFYSDAMRDSLEGSDPIDRLSRQLPLDYGAWDGFAQAQYLETAHLLPGYILSSQGDRMAMAHGVEGRFPFLDHRVVEFAASMPARVKMRALDEKYVLRRAARGLIPASIATRRKQPYRAPDAKSFFGARGAARDYVDEVLSSDTVARNGIFNPSAVKRLVSKVRTGGPLGVKDNMALVGILSTELLIHQFIRTFTHAKPSGRDTPVRGRQLPVRAGR